MQHDSGSRSNPPPPSTGHRRPRGTAAFPPTTGHRRPRGTAAYPRITGRGRRKAEAASPRAAIAPGRAQHFRPVPPAGRERHIQRKRGCKGRSPCRGGIPKGGGEQPSPFGPRRGGGPTTEKTDFPPHRNHPRPAAGSAILFPALRRAGPCGHQTARHNRERHSSFPSAGNTILHFPGPSPTKKGGFRPAPKTAFHKKQPVPYPTRQRRRNTPPRPPASRRPAGCGTAKSRAAARSRRA